VIAHLIAVCRHLRVNHGQTTLLSVDALTGFYHFLAEYLLLTM
jgi:hypothetical protein